MKGTNRKQVKPLHLVYYTRNFDSVQINSLHRQIYLDRPNAKLIMILSPIYLYLHLLVWTGDDCIQLSATVAIQVQVTII